MNSRMHHEQRSPVAPGRRWLAISALLASSLALGCASSAQSAKPQLRPALVRQAVAERDALAIVDELERLVDLERDTEEDREAAYEAVVGLEEDTAAYGFARAAVAGRLAQMRTLGAISLVAEVEQYARRSLELDPGFRDGEVKRMLGILYVLAPSMLLEHGNEELGVSLLEELVAEQPGTPENQLRLAEAYVEAGTPERAPAHLCLVAPQRDVLRAADQRLLERLLEEVEDERRAVACVGRTGAL